jgi:hypothetical protein
MLLAFDLDSLLVLIVLAPSVINISFYLFFCHKSKIQPNHLMYMHHQLPTVLTLFSRTLDMNDTT